MDWKKYRATLFSYAYLSFCVFVIIALVIKTKIYNYFGIDEESAVIIILFGAAFLYIMKAVRKGKQESLEKILQKLSKDELYAPHIELLKSFSESTRIDGINNLVQLARNGDEKCMNNVCLILCQHVMTATAADQYRAEFVNKPSRDIQYTLDILCRKDDLFKKASVILEGAYLRGADLTGASLDDSCIDCADLTDACLKSASLERAYLEYTSLERANLEGANLSESFLGDASLTSAKLKDANLTKAFIYNTSLKNADLSNAILKEAGLEGSDLDCVNLRGADLEEADFKNVKNFNLNDALMQGCKNSDLAVNMPGRDKPA